MKQKFLFLILLCAMPIAYGMQGVEDERSDLDKQLWNAAARIESKLVDQLLAQGANPNTKDGYGHFLLTFLAQSDWKEGKILICKQLIDAGADVNAYCYNGNFALYAAVNYGDDDLVQLLIEKGADPNLRTKSNPFNPWHDYLCGATALLKAVSRKYIKICKMLLSAGADPNIYDNSKDTPLMNYSSFELCELLLQYGANPSMKNSRGAMAIDLMRQRAAQYHFGVPDSLNKIINLLDDPEKIRAVILREDNPNRQMKALRKKEKNICSALMNRELGLRK